VFGGKSDALREFVREYFEDHENERIAAAVTPPRTRTDLTR
jgi:hypothetical protein